MSGLLLAEVESFLRADLFELVIGSSKRRIYDGPGGRSVTVRLDGREVRHIRVYPDREGPAVETDSPSLEWLDEVLP